MFDFTWNEEQLAFQSLVRDFVKTEVAPRAAALDAEPDPIKGIPWDIIKAANENGLRTIPLSKELGGAGLDSLTIGMLVEELSVGDLGVSVIFAQTWKFMQMFQDGCTQEQCNRFLIPLRDDPWGLMAAAVKEPESGSDHFVPVLHPKAGPKMSCVRDGDYAILNGTKEFISNGAIAHLYILFARSDPTVSMDKGMTAFAIPRDLPGVANVPGFTLGRVYDKLGERLAGNAELIFEDCRVPMNNMLFEWNNALKNVTARVRQSSAYAGASALGVGWAAFLERALEYSQIRVQGLVPIIKHANIAMKLGEMYGELKAAQLMLRKACWQCDRPELFDPMLSRSAKVFCSEVAHRTALASLRMFGGNGVMKDVGMEKLLRDAVIFLHSDACNESLDRGTGELLAVVPHSR